MLMKSHLAIGLFAALFFLPHVLNKPIFVLVVLVTSLIPDIDSGFSTLGRKAVFRPLQLFTKHRGFVHSFTTCFIITLVLAWFFPMLALPFFLGYSVHLIVDSFTIDGIRPIWPSEKVLKGSIKVGGVVEQSIFLIFCIADIILIILLFA